MSNTSRFAWVCLSALVVFVIWVATGGGSNAGIGFFYAVPVGLAAWWWGARAAAIAVAACCVLYVVGALIQPVPQFGVALAVRLTAFAVVGAVIALLRERMVALEHSAEELEAIRAALTPRRCPSWPTSTRPPPSCRPRSTPSCWAQTRGST